MTSDAAREIVPFDRLNRNNKNKSGPDFRPQFVQPDAPFASGPNDGQAISSIGEVGETADPKGSTVMESAISLTPLENSPKIPTVPNVTSTVVADSGVVPASPPEIS